MTKSHRINNLETATSTIAGLQWPNFIGDYHNNLRHLRSIRYFLKQTGKISPLAKRYLSIVSGLSCLE